MRRRVGGESRQVTLGAGVDPVHSPESRIPNPESRIPNHALTCLASRVPRLAFVSTVKTGPLRIESTWPHELASPARANQSPCLDA
jgi:hypothetical protein